MATLGNHNHASQQNTSRRSYITTGPFHEYFYSYSVTETRTTFVGTLELLPGISCETCPVGRILRETGRKLYPGANVGVNRYMVGVYDAVTLLNGFIDPNARVFTVYNSDKPTYIPDYDSSDDETAGSVDDLGPSVLTSGNIISTEGFVGIQSTIQYGETYAGSYLYEDVPIIEAGVNFDTNCPPENQVTPFTYATLYPDGKIESINYSNEPATRVTITADGNTFNTGNVSTLGSTAISQTLYVEGASLDPGNAAITTVNGSVVVQSGQIRASHVETAEITGDYTVDPALGKIFNIALGAGIAGGVVINVNNTDNTQIGAVVHLNIANYRNNGNGECTVEFKNNNSGIYMHTPGTLFFDNNEMKSVAFLIVNNSHVVEISRTGPLYPRW